MGKYERKRKATPGLDRKIKAVALQNRRVSCENLSTELAHEGIIVDRRTINNRPLEQGLKPQMCRKKPCLTQKMKQASYERAIAYSKLDIRGWSKVRYLIKIKRDYRITLLMLIMFF